MKKAIITTLLIAAGAFFFLLLVSDDAENKLTLAEFAIQKIVGMAGLIGTSRLWDYLRKKNLTIKL